MKFLLRFSSTSWRPITAGYYRSCWGFHISYHYRTLLSRHYLRRGRLRIIWRAGRFLISVFIRLAATVQPRPDFHTSWKSSSFGGWMQPRPLIKLNLYLALECKKNELLRSYSRGSLSWSFCFFELAALRDLKFETLQDEVFTSSIRQQKDVGSIFGKYECSYQSPPWFPVHYKQI